jgi:hypothetical protein
MEVIAVAVGVGYGMADTVVRRVQRNDEPPRPDRPIVDLREPSRPPVVVEPVHS